VLTVEAKLITSCHVVVFDIKLWFWWDMLYISSVKRLFRSVEGVSLRSRVAEAGPSLPVGDMTYGPPVCICGCRCGPGDIVMSSGPLILMGASFEGELGDADRLGSLNTP